MGSFGCAYVPTQTCGSAGTAFDLRLHSCDLLVERREPCLLIGCHRIVRGHCAMPCAGVQGSRPSSLGDRAPRLAIERHLNLVLARRGAAHLALVDVAVATGVDEGDAVDCLRLRKGEREHGRNADEPRFAELAVDAVLRAVGFGKVFRRR